MPKFPGIHVELVGQDGNAFAILGRVKTAMQRGGVSSEEISKFMEKAMSGDYDNLLRTVLETVTVVDAEDDEDDDVDPLWMDDEDNWEEYDDDDVYDYEEVLG